MLRHNLPPEGTFKEVENVKGLFELVPFRLEIPEARKRSSGFGDLTRLAQNPQPSLTLTIPFLSLITVCVCAIVIVFVAAKLTVYRGPLIDRRVRMSSPRFTQSLN